MPKFNIETTTIDYDAELGKKCVETHNWSNAEQDGFSEREVKEDGK